MMNSVLFSIFARDYCCSCCSGFCKWKL